jgi:hypothetical protein
MPHRSRGANGQSSAFPRSKTFRWLLGQPFGRGFGSALLTVAMSRLPLGRFIATALLARRPNAADKLGGAMTKISWRQVVH